MNKRIENLRKHYKDMSDKDIQKACEKVEYVIYDRATKEIVQNGDMDRLAYDKYRVPSTQGKLIIDENSSWKLRGEFTDFEGDGKRMFNVQGKALKCKAKHDKALKALRRPEDKG